MTRVPILRPAPPFYAPDAPEESTMTHLTCGYTAATVHHTNRAGEMLAFIRANIAAGRTCYLATATRVTRSSRSTCLRFGCAATLWRSRAASAGSITPTPPSRRSKRTTVNTSTFATRPARLFCYGDRGLRHEVVSLAEALCRRGFPRQTLKMSDGLSERLDSILNRVERPICCPVRPG